MKRKYPTNTPWCAFDGFPNGPGDFVKRSLTERGLKEYNPTRVLEWLGPKDFSCRNASHEHHRYSNGNIWWIPQHDWRRVQRSPEQGWKLTDDTRHAHRWRMDMAFLETSQRFLCPRQLSQRPLAFNRCVRKLAVPDDSPGLQHDVCL